MAETLISPGISLSETDMSTVVTGPVVTGAAIIGPTVTGPVLVPTKVTSYSEYERVFGTTFVDVDPKESDKKVVREFMTSIAAKNYFDQGGESILVIRVAEPKAFTCAKSAVYDNNDNTYVVDSETNLGFKLATLGEGDIFNSFSNDQYSGTTNNFKFEVTKNVDNSFNVIIRRGDDTDDDKIILETWNNLSLDSNDSNYIAAVIGNQEIKYTNGEVETIGEFANKSAYVRVSEVTGTNSTIVNLNFEKKICLFTEAKGTVGKAYSSDGAEADNAKIGYFSEILKDTTYPQAVSPAQYEPAIDLLKNSDDYQFNTVIAPGLMLDMTEGKEQLVNLVNVCKERGDAIAVIDPCCYGTKEVNSVVNQGVNNSYGAAYWPWLQVYSSTGRLVWVPASVLMPGVYAYSDNLTAPWYAPAGMTRGGIAAVQASKKLNKSERDILYAKNINPIATLPGTGLVVYGQKTLQQKATSLNRVNVRRLLIELKRNVKEMASELLFEQNTTALRNNFEAELDTYLANVVQRKGLYNYSINLDGNTAEAIDRCEFHCTIKLQPTKVVEFIYINFAITSTGVEFS